MDIEPITRSAFLVRSALAVGAVSGAAAVGPWTTRALAQESDAEILNYALTLEYLQTELYDRALDEVSGIDGELRELVTELRDNEQEHVDALTAAVEQLGADPAEKPRFAFGDAFGDLEAFLRTANILEDTGVSAYNGAAPNIESEEMLAAAGSIVQVEGRHAALIRLRRDVPPAPLAFDKSSTMDEVLEAVQPFIQD